MATISQLMSLMPRTPAKRTLKRHDDTDKEALFRLVWEIPRLGRLAIDRRLRPLGLSEAKWRTVWHLSRGPVDMNQAELAGRLGVEAPTMARLLDRLAADGWVERRATATDRRVKTIHLLPKASSVIREIDRTVNVMRNEILTELSRTELRACIKTLQHIQSRAELAARE